MSWEANEQDHTFSTGRTFRVRRGLAMQWLMTRAVERGDDEVAGLLGLLIQKGAEGEDVKLDDGVDPRAVLLLQRDLVEAMFVRPRVIWDAGPDEIPAAAEVDGMPTHISGADLHDVEISEVMEIAFRGVADAARFPGLADRVAAGDDGARVGKGAKRATRPASRKR